MTYCPACNHVTEGSTQRCGSCAVARPDGGWPLDPRLQTIVAGGQYRVLRRLGAGGFGTVYEVETLVGGLRRALKVLHPERAQDARTRERFINEAIVLEQLNHPNVARCYAAGVLDGGHALYLLLELIDGVPLSSLLEQADGTPAPFDPLRAARVGKQIASGLVAVHASGVLHRDLTPRNVLVTNAGTRDERVTLVDFGVADALEPETVSGRTLLGTPRFIPPEAFVAGAELDARCDLWQLGAVLHVMLWGTPPGADVPPGATPSAALDALVARLLARDPHDRPASALEACEALARVEHALVDADYADDALALVDALCARPSEQAWASICRFLMSRPDASELVERAAALLHAWPDDLRRAPLSWWQRVRHEGTHPLWLLARTLDLSGQALDDDDVLAMAAQPALASIAHLVLADNHIGNRGMQALAAARPLAGLRALTLRDNRITGDAVACLPGVLRHLTRLDLAHNGLGARGAELVAAAPLALASLDLAGNDIGTRGAEAIAASDTCAGLERLSLADNGIGSDGVSATATSRSLAQVRELDLSRNRIGPAGAAALALSANVSNLASLSLAQNALGLEGLELLLSSHKFSQLETLDLSSNDIGPQGAMALSASPLVRRVKTLAVADNRLGDAGLAALLGAPFLSGLRSLDTAQNEVTGGGIALLRGAPLELNALDLSRNPLGRDGLNALAATLPRLRLRRLAVADCGFPPSAFNVLTAAAPITLRSLDVAGNRLGATPGPAPGTPTLVCRLDALDVSRNALSADGLSTVLRAPAALTVTHLAANSNSFGDEAAALVAALETLPSLTRLELRDCRLAAAHTRALVRSNIAGRLRSLDLAFNQLADGAAAAIAEPPGCHALHALVLDNNDISYAAASSILAAPAMPLLQRATFARNALKSVIDLHSLARRKIELLEQSFAAASADGARLAERFYARLFERHPALKPLFAHTSMRRQQQHLVSALGLVIDHLRAPDQVIGALEALASRHVGYGAYPSHYQAVAVTMMETLREVLGPRWSTEIDDAWHDGLAAIGGVMMRAHQRAPAASADSSGAAGVPSRIA
jgi:hemoglobin-like flavoprotein/Ran GTPase-activating protein (RanGAP) involved in mRNA processing and transport/tRNA A-37 threonylcarbamoyl transferase component Bud32